MTLNMLIYRMLMSGIDSARAALPLAMFTPESGLEYACLLLGAMALTWVPGVACFRCIRIARVLWYRHPS